MPRAFRLALIAPTMFAACVSLDPLTGGDAGSSDAAPPADAAPPSDGPSDAAQERACASDLATDAKNCGACGHDCLGGDCVAGVCQPVTLATGEDSPAAIRVVAGTLYWLTMHGHIRACSAASCATTKRYVYFDDAGADNAPGDLAVDPSGVYWTDYYASLVRTCPTAGCPASPTTFKGQGIFPLGIGIDAKNLYYTWEQGGEGVGRCPKSGCTTIDKVSEAPILSRDIGLDDTYVYWLAAGYPNEPPGTLDRAPKDGADASPVTLHGALESPGGMVVVAPFVYVTEWGAPDDAGAQKGGRITRVKVDTVAETFVTGLSKPGLIVSDGTSLYWINGGDGSIGSCPLAGCNATAATIARGQNAPASLAVDDRAVYWCNGGDGAIRALAK